MVAEIVNLFTWSAKGKPRRHSRVDQCTTTVPRIPCPPCASHTYAKEPEVANVPLAVLLLPIAPFAR
jgi:hypothetical protein